MIKQLMRGAFNRKPPQPRFTNTWDVDMVLNHVQRMGDNKDLSLNDISLKLAMLMALTTAARGSELQKKKKKKQKKNYPQCLTDSGDQMVFQIPGLTKTKRPNKPHMSVSVHSYTENSQLDLVGCVREYLSRTAPLRKHWIRNTSCFLASQNRTNRSNLVRLPDG